MQISVAHDFLPKRNSTRASIVMDLFGIGFEQGRHVIAEGLPLPVEEDPQGQIVLFTGESGSGKSSLLRGVAGELSSRGRSLADVDEFALEEKTLVDAVPLDLQETLQLLAACGLAEAHLMLRTPAELSDGQRYRFRLALALARGADWILADEFTATLDRRLANVVAANLRKLADRTGHGFLLASTHEDLLEDLSPEVHVECRVDGTITVNAASAKGSASPGGREGEPNEKKRPRSRRRCGSPRGPAPTGRTSLGGITAATPSGRSGS